MKKKKKENKKTHTHSLSFLTRAAPVNLNYATRLDWLFFGCYLVQILALSEVLFVYSVLHRIRKDKEQLEKDKKRTRKLTMMNIDVQWENTPKSLKMRKFGLHEKAIKLRKFDILLSIVLTLGFAAMVLGVSLGYFPNETYPN